MYPGIKVTLSRTNATTAAIKILNENRARKNQSDVFDGTVTVVPLTETRPSVMSFSLARRDATPACDRIFWRRSMVSSIAGSSRSHEGHEEHYRLDLRVLRAFVVCAPGE